MQEKILETFTEYVRTNNLTPDNLDEFFKTENYTVFFNNITVSVLGEPTFTHDRNSDTSGSLVYMPESSKGRFAKSIDILYVNSLYYGVLGRLEYNYPTYIDFIKSLKIIRTELKRVAYHSNDTTAKTTQQLIKIYMNLIYCMIDNNNSVLTSSQEAPRQFIVEESKKVILMIVSYLMNKSIPIYSINTDEIHTDRLSTAQLDELQNFYNTKCSQYIDTDVSPLVRENINSESAYYINKKRLITGNMRSRGILFINKDKVLSENRNYFGRNFPNIFPEYTL